MSDIYNMFDALQASFEKKAPTGGGQYKDILRLEKDKVYEVRLFPFRVEVDGQKEINTTFDFSYHGWKSYSTGKYVEYLDPQMIDQPNPIAKFSYGLTDQYKEMGLDKEDSRMKKARKIWKQQGWLVNALIVDDPVNPDNNGKVKILRVGKQIHDIIQNHFMGLRKADFGARVFDLSPKGCNLCLVVGDNGAGFKNYKESYFKNPSDIGVTAEESEEYWDNRAFNLSEVYTVKSYDELKEAIDVHFLDKEVDASDGSEENVPDLNDLSKELDSEPEVKAPVEESKPAAKAKAKTKTPAKSKAKSTPKTEEVEEEDGEFNMDQIMADLEMED